MKKKVILLLILIVALSGFLRFKDLTSIPKGLYPDEAINGNNAVESLQKKDFDVFYPDNNGREGLFLHLLAFSFWIFGISKFSLKFIPALVGTLTIPGIFLLTRELFSFYPIKKKNYLALLASFLTGISFWHINFSRIAFRGILLPFCLVYSFYFFLKGLRENNFLFSGLGGFFFGLAFYTYSSVRLAPFIFVILFLFLLIIAKHKKYFLKYISTFTLTSILTALPLGIFFLKFPSYFSSRSSGIMIFNQPNPLKAFAISLGRHLIMFNFLGDPNWRHNFAHYPQLLWPIGIAFILGVIFATIRIYYHFKNKEFYYITPYLILFSWTGIMLLPGILTFEGLPHSLRVIGVIPPVYIFAAIGFFFLKEKIDMKNKKEGSKRKNIITIIILFTFIMGLAFTQYNKYFNKWGENKEVERSFNYEYVKVGNYLNSLDDNIKAFAIINKKGDSIRYPDKVPMSAQTPVFIETSKFKKPRATYLKINEIKNIKKEDKKIVIVPIDVTEEIENEIKTNFPSGEIDTENGLWKYKINFN
ncbi:MAG: hypothetical protein ACOC1P_02585 [Minisyncoccales bacterium]